MSVARLPEKKIEKDSLAVARRVLGIETAALERLSQALNESFPAAVEMIGEAEGRVIVTGIGKSGHVGKKIAATLASTGTPAFFIHPAEASHGDMGMIVRGDVILAISNSGEAKELNDIISYAKRFAIPLIAVTGRKESTLGSRADLALLTPPVPEACPNGLAPTTSTTLVMALGDALAIALLERKGFTADDYKNIHPGGKLGQQLMRVSEIMQAGERMPVASDAATMADVVRIMTEKDSGCLILTDGDGRLSGVVTDADLRRNLFNDKSETLMSWATSSRSRRWKKSQPVSDIMDRAPRAISPGTLVVEAMAIMGDLKNTARRATQLVVVDKDNRPVGLLHIHDCLRAGFA